MTNLFWLGACPELDLQLFAGEGGGAGGDGGGTAAGAATGDGATGIPPDSTDAEAAAQQRLRELGVPENVLQKRAKRSAPKAAAAVTTAKGADAGTQVNEQAAAAANNAPTKDETPTESTKRMSWQEIMNDPEYNREMQLVVQSRLKTAKGAEETLTKLTPALELLARKYQLDPANIDHEALAEAISRDGAYYEARALEMGVPVETAMKVDQQERTNARETRRQADTMREEMHRAHIAKLYEQGEAMKAIFPDFDLRQELKNPAFARMTAPGKGLMSVEDAYRAVHRKELEEAAHAATVRQTTEQVTNAVLAGQRRPVEAGVSGQSPSQPQFDYSKASPAEREAFKKRIRDAAAEGKKIYPGGR